MAKIISNEPKTSALDARKEYANLNNDRGTKELNIGLEAKSYLDTFFTALNDAPSMKGTYYSTDIGGTSFSETLNNQKDIVSATRFNKVEGFVIFGQKNEEEIETNTESTEREIGNEVTDQECVVLQGTLVPIVGDHFMFDSQERHAVPYKVTKVVPVKLVDKSVYSISLSPSPTFLSMDQLDEITVDTYTFIFGNIGSHKKSILLKDTVEILINLSKSLRMINDLYVECFYNETHDMLRYPSLTGNCSALLESNVWVGSRALRFFQNNEGVLSYGYDMNRLFAGYPFVSKHESRDYKRSIYYKIQKRKLDKLEIIDDSGPVDLVPPIPSGPIDMSSLYDVDFKMAMELNEENLIDCDEDDTLENYVAQYDLTSTLHQAIRSEYSILTSLRKTGITSHEFNNVNSKGSKTVTDGTGFVNYNPTSSIFNYIIDKWMVEDYNSIINAPYLHEYEVSSQNIDDYFFIPIIMWIVSKSIEEVEKDRLVVSF